MKLLDLLLFREPARTQARPLNIITLLHLIKINAWTHLFGRAVPGYRGSGPVFASDEDAWRHVAGRARGGNALHRRALDFLAARAPEEREAIRATTGY